MNPPIDVGRCAAMMGLPRNRVYDQYFVRLLVKDAWERQRYFPDLPPLRFPRRMTIRLFDDLYTATRNGFVDALDYYRRASSLPLIGRIAVPTLILTARDDPFIAVEPFEELKAPANVTVQHSAARRAHRVRRLGRLRRGALGRIASRGLGSSGGANVDKPSSPRPQQGSQPELCVGDFRLVRIFDSEIRGDRTSPSRPPSAGFSTFFRENR